MEGVVALEQPMARAPSREDEVEVDPRDLQALRICDDAGESNAVRNAARRREGVPA